MGEGVAPWGRAGKEWHTKPKADAKGKVYQSLPKNAWDWWGVCTRGDNRTRSGAFAMEAVLAIGSSTDRSVEQCEYLRVRSNKE